MNDPLVIKNQRISDECTSCALASIAEDTLKQIVDPEYIYENSKTPGFGISKETALNAVFYKGVKTETGEIRFPFTATKSTLPWILRFDSILRLLQKNKKSLFCGIYWQDEWTNSTDGIMKTPKEWLTWFPHAFKIYDYTEINGIIYLKVQNSIGDTKGDKGIWYMPKEIANKLNFAIQIL